MAILLLALAAAQAPAPGIAVTNTVPPTVAVPPQGPPAGGVPSLVVNAVGPPPVIVAPDQLPPPFVEGLLREVARPPQERGPAHYISPDDYPPAAAGAEGTVRVSLLTDQQGRVTECRIKRSSGSPVLDVTTCRLLARRARYIPAVDRKGNPSIGTIEQEVTWKAPGRRE